ncbi:putative RNA recognition motif domain, nucleotide-binding alpha-beta plait domain superfamily [Helianthus annuus]|nr:putative RNA recognition motif domain, nucleotide-binding alpha-beta plait domain superfamily [Helianthus annuus]
MAAGVTKYYVANIPDGCRPWDLASLLSNYGDIAGSYIARKRSKEGQKFGFVSFKGVIDWKELEKRMQGVKLGGCKLKINRARFARENGSEEDRRFPSSTGQPKLQKGVEDVNHIRHNAFSLPGRSYCSALLNNLGDVSRQVDVVVEPEREISVHGETSAFFDLQGRAVLGRSKDFESFISIKNNLVAAGVKNFKLYYLGGLNLMIAFEDDIDASDFILNVDIWKNWFETLDVWSGQSLAYERIAWIKFHGVPLHLAENKVFDDVAALFGKVIKGSQLSPLDWDLSTNCVGILVDDGARISGSVILKWKSKKFKIWIMEELDDWVPDCMFEDESSENFPGSVAGAGDGVSVSSSLHGESNHLGNEKSVGDEGLQEVAVNAENEKSDNFDRNVNVEVEDVSSNIHRDLNQNLDNVGVGPSIFSNVQNMQHNQVLSFASTGTFSKPKNKKGKLRPRRGGPSRMNGSSQSADRPKKRQRAELDDSDPFDLNRFLNTGIFKSHDVECSIQKNVESVCHNPVISSRLDLNVSFHSPVSGADSGAADHFNRDKGVQPGVLNDAEVAADSSSDAEVDATVLIGAAIGMQLDHHGDLVKEIIRNEGNNGVPK